MQRIAVRQKECKYLFLINYFAPAIPKEPGNLALHDHVETVQQGALLKQDLPFAQSNFARNRRQADDFALA